MSLLHVLMLQVDVVCFMTARFTFVWEGVMLRPGDLGLFGECTEEVFFSFCFISSHKCSAGKRSLCGCSWERMEIDVRRIL